VMASHTKSELREAAQVLAAALPASAREAALRTAAGAAPPSGAADAERPRVFDGLADAA
jgi:hypothetical protein